ncbi:tryptophan-rich sensory protein [Sorlinia euscelidii]|uniref:Uncharacterized protein n=1 Tax=Sorlinia euscelidii TaxID=3081148 RepID=A0ABU7TZX1_9PROT
MRPFPAIISFSAVATSLAIGGWMGPARQGAATARWYRDLAKPDLTPPPYIFATIWPILGLGLAFYGYRAMTDTQSHLKRTRITLWALLTAGILAFPLVAFQWRRLQVATGLAAAMALLASGASPYPAGATLKPHALSRRWCYGLASPRGCNLRSGRKTLTKIRSTASRTVIDASIIH